jgi:hypothetical protein
MGSAKIIEGALRQHTEGAPAVERGLRDSIDGAISACGDDDPLLLPGAVHGALRQHGQLPGVLDAPDVVASARLFEDASDRFFPRCGVAVARTRIEHDEEGALRGHSCSSVRCASMQRRRKDSLSDPIPANGRSEMLE